MGEELEDLIRMANRIMVKAIDAKIAAAIAEHMPKTSLSEGSTGSGNDAQPENALADSGDKNGTQEPGEGDWVDRDGDVWRKDADAWVFWNRIIGRWSEVYSWDDVESPSFYGPFHPATDADYERTGAPRPEPVKPEPDTWDQPPTIWPEQRFVDDAVADSALGYFMDDPNPDQARIMREALSYGLTQNNVTITDEPERSVEAARRHCPDGCAVVELPPNRDVKFWITTGGISSDPDAASACYAISAALVAQEAYR